MLQKLRTEAEAMKAEYEQNLQNARAEANQIVARAQKTATARGEEIVGEARAQAAALKQKAEADIAQERKKAVNEVKGRDRRHGHGDRLQGGRA
ncbi:MAG: ATP synthase F0 subunit B [Faecalibacterium sp.]